MREPRPRGVAGGQPLKQGSRGLNLGVPMAWSQALVSRGATGACGVGSQPQHRAPLPAALPVGRPGHPGGLPLGLVLRSRSAVWPRAWRGSTRPLGARPASARAGPQGERGSGGNLVRERGRLRGVSAAPGGFGDSALGWVPTRPKPPEDGATRGSQWRAPQLRAASAVRPGVATRWRLALAEREQQAGLQPLHPAQHPRGDRALVALGGGVPGDSPPSRHPGSLPALVLPLAVRSCLSAPSLRRLAILPLPP